MFLSRGDRDLGVAFQTHPGEIFSTDLKCNVLGEREMVLIMILEVFL